jgi:hypothetical protein
MNGNMVYLANNIAYAQSTNAVTALNLAQSLNSNVGIEILEGLRAV